MTRTPMTSYNYLIRRAFWTTSKTTADAFVRCKHPHYHNDHRTISLELLLKTSGFQLGETEQLFVILLEAISSNRKPSLINTFITATFHHNPSALVTLSNGFRIPKSARNEVASGAINADVELSDIPSEFDGLRFYNERQESNEARSKFQVSSEKELNFPGVTMALPTLEDGPGGSQYGNL
ncbi:phoma betae P450 monooxygenase No.2 [Colletotrichum cuscutae]|uniref:Phoma betae P450 monooxygenase No.2 n=1 Tax=Colletotrichum cuscutae TaxID=1209917 RepID=A0AAI9XZ16_9PEZI|nr:phoma betae P450 monooxygenase No.2 [Colletotrichum cuscutae]